MSGGARPRATRKGRGAEGQQQAVRGAGAAGGAINLSDPDSRVMRTQGTPPRQAYNAQTAVNDRQIILAAEISLDAPDFGHLDPMLDRTLAACAAKASTETPEVVLADAGYWHTAQMQQIAEQGIEVLVPPDGNMREGKRPGWEHGVYEQMREKLKTERGRKLYAQRKITDRAGVRADQIQPPHRPVHAKRPGRRTVGVAVSGSDPQPAQTPQPLDRQPRLTPGRSLSVPVDRAGWPHIPTASRLSSSLPMLRTVGRATARSVPADD